MVVSHKARLNGTSDWKPFGESMLSIIHRICVVNQLGMSNLPILFGRYGAKTFKIDKRLNPENKDGIDLDKLSQLCSWDVNTLSGSYGEFYVWPALWFPTKFSKHNNNEKIIERRPLHKNIRLCPTCALDGVHLVIHQLRGWALCPIHKEKLLNACPSCHTVFEDYMFSHKGHPRLVSACSHCNWNQTRPKKISNSDLESRHRYISEYREWIKMVSSVTSRDNDSMAFIGSPDFRFDISRVEKLVPGPSWLRECLTNTSDLITSVHHKSNAVFIPREYSAESLFNNPLRETPGCQVGNLLPKMTFHSSKCVEEVELSIKSMNTELFQGIKFDSSRVKAGLNRHSDIAVKPWYLWRIQFDRYFRPSQRMKYHEEVETLADMRLWDFWRKGPAKILRDQNDVENAELALWVNRLWWRQTFLESYYWIFRIYLSFCVDDKLCVLDREYQYQNYLEENGLFDPFRNQLGLLVNTEGGVVYTTVKKRACHHATLVEKAKNQEFIDQTTKSLFELFSLVQEHLNGREIKRTKL